MTILLAIIGFMSLLYGTFRAGMAWQKVRIGYMAANAGG